MNLHRQQIEKMKQGRQKATTETERTCAIFNTSYNEKYYYVLFDYAIEKNLQYPFDLAIVPWYHYFVFFREAVMGKKEDSLSRVFIAVVLIGALGSIVIGIILIFKKSVWLGIGVYLIGQIVSGLPFLVLGVIGQKNGAANPNNPATNATSMLEIDKLVAELAKKPEATTEEEPQDNGDDPIFADITNDWWADWESHPKDTQEVHFAVNSGKKDTPLDSKKEAKTNVDISLVQYVNCTITTYASRNGNTMEVTTIQKSSADLSQARYKYHIAEDGTCYVLAALPTGELAGNLKAEISTKFIKNPAAEEANKKMQEAIDKYFGTDTEKSDQK